MICFTFHDDSQAINPNDGQLRSQNPPKSNSVLVDSQHTLQARSQRAVWFHRSLEVHSLRSSRSASSICTIAPKPLVAWKRWTSELDAPPANFRLDAVGRSRQGRLLRCGGPSQVEESHAEAAAIASEPSRMHTRTAKWTNSQNYRILAWRSPPMAIADVHHTCHICQVKCTRININKHLRVPSSHVRSEAEKRLSREAILHTELALEWPELVQIGTL